MKICPACFHHNREGYMFCEDCGEDITLVAGVPDINEFSGPESGIAIQIDSQYLPLTFQDSAQLLLGRYDPDRNQQPDIDLNDFEAFEKGVSVMHAALVRDADGIKLMDIGSKNGTYLNGRRLTPEQQYVIRDGDEIRLSRLVAYLYIRGSDPGLA